MKSLLSLTLLSLLLVLMGCSNNSEEPSVDCDQSDLAVSISSSSAPTCSTAGSIVVAGSGGSEPYEFSLNGTDFQSSGEFSGIVAGALTITIQDADGCTAELITVITSNDGISLSLSTTASSCSSATGSIDVTVTGGDGSYMYQLDGGEAQASSTFTNVSSGDHEVTATDGTGCSSTKEVYVSSTVSLSDNIMPLLQRECTFSGCHNGDNGSDRNWTVKSNVLAKAAVIRSRTQSGSMPRSPGELTQAEIDLIACWVDDGANDN